MPDPRLRGVEGLVEQRRVGRELAAEQTGRGDVAEAVPGLLEHQVLGADQAQAAVRARLVHQHLWVQDVERRVAEPVAVREVDPLGALWAAHAFAELPEAGGERLVDSFERGAMRVYAVPNLGRWYDFGFMLGIGGFSGGVFAGSRKRS